MTNRCAWSNNDAMRDYHDKEWGIPQHDDRVLFEFLTLEGAQSGLSWATILAKRQNYRHAFDNFDVKTIAAYDQNKIDELLANPGIVRNKLKINSVVINAKAVLAIQREFGSFDAYIWAFVGGKPIENAWKSLAEAPTTTEISNKLSTALKKRGFKFIGSGICYSFMQAVGMVNDHTTDCFRYSEIRALG